MAEKIATRHAYGEALAEIGSDPKIVALDADVSSCTMSCMFAQKYPERFFNMGIAEANMIGAAAGLSTYGFTPFVHAFAMFMAGRGYDQIRNSICYPNLNVKCVGTHGGLRRPHFGLGVLAGGIKNARPFQFAHDLAVLAVDGGGFARFTEFRLVLVQKLLPFRNKRFDFAEQPFHVVLALTDDLPDWRDQKIVEHNQSDKKVRQLDP